jgi:hypothetical protein
MAEQARKRANQIRYRFDVPTWTSCSSGRQGLLRPAGWRPTTRLRDHPGVELTLVDRHDYHQAITELPRAAGGTRAADAVRSPFQDVPAKRVRFVETEEGFRLKRGDLASVRLLPGTITAVEKPSTVALISIGGGTAMIERAFRAYQLTSRPCMRAEPQRLEAAAARPLPNCGAAS